jgi:hypothetical protein
MSGRFGWELAAVLVVASVQSPGCSEPTGIANSANPAVVDGGPGGVDAAGATGDALPIGAISLFNRKSCPSGWDPLVGAEGRTLVPTVGNQAPGASYGKPLDDGEDRQHTHNMPVTVNLPSVNYAGIAGEANHGVARAGNIPLTVTGSKAGLGLPYVQLLVCQKQVPPDLSQRSVPAGTLMFFKSTDCPGGWGQAGGTQGRILVGVPDGATAGQKFGGTVLTGTDKRPHHHGFAGSITTSAHGIALASGGAASGYAKDGEHPYNGNTEDSDAALPYLQLLHCQKL